MPKSLPTKAALFDWLGDCPSAVPDPLDEPSGDPHASERPCLAHILIAIVAASGLLASAAATFWIASWAFMLAIR